MPESKEKPSESLGSKGVKRKESCRKNALRRAIDRLIRDQDSSEGPQDVDELYRKYFPSSKYFPGSSDEEWLRVLNSKSYREVHKKVPSGNVKNSPNKPPNSTTEPLSAQTHKGTQNLLTKDGEVAAPLTRLFDPCPSGNSCTFPPSKPIVLLDKLENGSLQLAAHDESHVSNFQPLATSTPAERRKFFQSGRKLAPPPNRRLPRTVNGISDRERLELLSLIKSRGKRDATLLPTVIITDCKGGSTEFEGNNSGTLLQKENTSKESELSDPSLSNKGRCGPMKLTHCIMELDIKRARHRTPIQMNGIHEESNIREENWSAREIEPGSTSKRKASPVKDNRIVKVGRVYENSEKYERGKRSCKRTLLGDRSEKCEKIPADISELQNCQNGHTVNQSESVKEAVESAVGNEEESYDECLSKRMMEGAVESTVRNEEESYDEYLSKRMMEGPVDCTTVSDALRSVRKSSCGYCKKATSPSLQPVVVLRKLTNNEICQRKEISRNCVEDGESIDSEDSLLSFPKISRNCVEDGESIDSEDSLLSFPKVYRKKIYDRDREGYRKCYSSKSKSLKCVVQSSEQDRPGCGSEAGVFSTVCQTPAMSCNTTVTNKPQNEGSYHCSGNGMREYTFDKLNGCIDVEKTFFKYSSDEETSNSSMSSNGMVDSHISTVLGSDNRICCRKDKCQVATPELIGLENPITSNRCWMNVTLQTLFSMENFMQSMIRAFEDVKAEDNSLISCILTLHYARSLGHQECVYEQARKLAEVLGTLNSDYNLNDQQDPSEFILWLFNAFEPVLEKYGPSWASTLITDNFRFEMEERTCCQSCLDYNVKISSFLILMLDINVEKSKIRSIQDALAAYTSPKTVRRTCSQCGDETSRVKTAFKSVPRYLIINLKRYSVMEGEVIRDQTLVRHTNTLSLEKYSVPNSKNNCSNDTRSVAVASPSKYDISRRSLRRTAGGDYELISIIHHSGFSASSGHYVCDVYHASTQKWYSYNDKMVKEICEVTLSLNKKQKTGYIYVYQNKNC